MLRVDAILKATEELKVESSGVRYSDPKGEVYEITGDISDSKITEIETKADAILAEYDAKQYQRDRQYPEIGEQLDMLFHDMTAGKGSKDGEWYKVVAKVKSDNPKPE